jgi:hypothetical protein
MVCFDSIHFNSARSQISSFQGDRISRASIAFASSLSGPWNRSALGSQRTGFPVRREMAPMWQTTAEPWPISTSQIGRLRVRTPSRKLPMWLVETESRSAASRSGSSISRRSLAPIRPRLTKSQPRSPRNRVGLLPKRGRACAPGEGRLPLRSFGTESPGFVATEVRVSDAHAARLEIVRDP